MVLCFLSFWRVSFAARFSVLDMGAFVDTILESDLSALAR